MQSTIKFPGFDKLFKIGSPQVRGEFTARLGLDRKLEFQYLRGEIGVVPTPIAASWAIGGRAPGDIVWTDRSLLIVSDRVVEVLNDNKLTGWSTYPVTLTNRDDEILNGYCGLAITGRCGEIDNSRCQIVPKQYPAGEFPVYRGIYFDESTWDGSDIFCFSGGGARKCVTERFRAAVEEAGLRDIDFEALSCVDRMQL